MKNSALVHRKVITLIISNQLDNRPLRQGRWVVEDKPSVLNACSECNHAFIVAVLRGVRTPVDPVHSPFALNGVVNATFPGITGGSVRGIRYVEPMVSAMVTVPDGQGVLRAQLAESVPTLENGLWRLLPDGRTETTWRIREGTRWHDGTPVTSADLLLTAQVFNDQGLPEIRRPAWRYVEGTETPDDRTIVAHWKQPYIEADGLFAAGGRSLAQHLLGQAYREDKAGFLQHPYWSAEFIGTGPFELRTWQGHSFLVLEANDRYFWVAAGLRVEPLSVESRPVSQLQPPLPSNNFVGNNRSRYVNPDFDALIEKYYAAVPTAQRTRLLAGIVHHLTDNLTLMGVHHATQVDLVTKRLINVLPVNSEDGRLTWNVHEWELK